MAYGVQTPVFEGPFDLLLHLILRDEVELYEISLSQIVDAYLVELERMSKIDLDVATEFLLIATTLVELKARRLTPSTDALDLDDELALWEERDLLLARLVECKMFKDTARSFERLMAMADLVRPRCAGVEDAFADVVPDPMAWVTPARLARAYERATAPKPVRTLDLSHVAPIRVSVVEVASEVAAHLRAAGRSTFRDMTAHIQDRILIVVHFLAVLELFKQGVIELEQRDNFGTITVEWCGGDHSGMPAGLTADAYEG